jgi:hypothetical protein
LSQILQNGGFQDNMSNLRSDAHSGAANQNYSINFANPLSQFKKGQQQQSINAGTRSEFRFENNSVNFNKQ